MTTRRELLKAHRFQSQRLVSALVGGQPDTPEQPMRRIGGATFGGVMIAIIILVGFGVVGLVNPGGSDAWREAGRVVVEKETGARFVLIDGALHPVINYSSALLLTGGGETVRVDADSIVDAPRGPAIGIPGAPDLLPPADDLATFPLSVCSTTTGDEEPVVTVAVGTDVPGDALGDSQALLVQDAGSDLHLVLGGQRLATSEPVAQGLGFESPIMIDDLWLNSIPAGPDLLPPPIGAVNTPTSIEVAGAATSVGQVFEVSYPGNRIEYFVMLSDGLAEISETEAAILVLDPATAAANPDRAYTQVASTQLPSERSDDEVSNPALPSTPPDETDLPAGDPALCTVARDDGNTDIVVSTESIDDAREVAPGVGEASVADRVAVAPGSGGLVRLLPGPDQPPGTLHLITDTGYAYPIGDDALSALGYSPDDAVELPTNLLRLLPIGPALDPNLALQPVTAGG